MSRPTNEEVDAAQQTLKRNYYAGVRDDAADIIRAYFDGEFSDEDGLRERLDGLEVIYTSEQYLILFCSDNSDAGLDEARGLGHDDVRDILGPWATLTYQADVREVVGDSELLFGTDRDGPLSDELDDDDRLVWLAGHHGKFLHWDRGHALFLVGRALAGQRDEVDLGVVSIDLVSPGTVRASRRSTWGALVDVVPLLRDRDVQALERASNQGPWLDFVLAKGLVAPGLAEVVMRAVPEDRPRLLLEAMLRTRFGADTGEEEPVYQFGDDATLTELLAANPADSELIEALLTLKVGADAVIDRGAGGETRLKRVV